MMLLAVHAASATAQTLVVGMQLSDKDRIRTGPPGACAAAATAEKLKVLCFAEAAASR